jgi:type VI secretion system protein ImpK
VLLGVFFLLRILLGNDADALSDRLVALHPDTQITLERAAFVPAVIPDTRDQTQLERIRGKIGADDEIAGCLNATGVGDEIVISVCNVLLFDSGKATVKPEFADLAAKIAESLQNEPGPIRVIGHTDNVKPSGAGRFKTNFDLSVARAEAVKDVMAPMISDPTRFAVEGRGELDPLCTENTDECRAQNRRVEILIPREETLEQAAGTF